MHSANFHIATVIASFHRAERIDDANTDHRRIAAPILQRRATAAERLMRRHISDAAQAATELDSDTSASTL